MLRFFLFGSPRLEHNGQILPLRRTKALALLAYMMTTEQPQDRETLLTLFWPEFDADSARNNLRRELSLLKSTVDEELLVADRLQVRRNSHAGCWLDTEAFHQALALTKQHAHPPDTLCAECAAALALAVQLYTDDFLAGFTLPDSQAFDEWQFFQREQLRQQLAMALQALISWHRSLGEFEQALAFARRWLQLDGLHEPAQRELMRLYAWSGQPAAALRQFRECARLLDAELGVEPEPETTALYEDIKSRRLDIPSVTSQVPLASTHAAAQEAAPAPPRQSHLTHNLPHTAGFVGRQRELADLVRRLTDPACRLLTLAGPGGIGKTRLALQAARTLAEGWAGEETIADGVLFVPLATVETSGGLISALAAAAHITFYPNVPPQQQVFDFFHAKRMLLLLDNFEQLLDEAAFVGKLLEAAPHLRLLVTSRVALNLREEWFHPIEGLSFPTEDEDSATVARLAGYDAVRLFEQHARRVRSDFVLSRQRGQVIRLCRLIAGMPLAIELAASWLKMLSVEQVVAALERGIDILTSRDRDIPERHRSMRAVLEESWRLLSQDAQQALAGLAVFAGGFSADAARTVVGASLDVLASLIEQSLLRAEADGRFQLHELLRQFAMEQLAADTQRARVIEEQHTDYYLRFLAEREARLQSHDQRAAVIEIVREAANVRTAWKRAIVNGNVERIDMALMSCSIYYLARNDFQEADEMLCLATTMVPNTTRPADDHVHTRVRARALIQHGSKRYSLGDYTTAVRNIEAGLVAAHELGLQQDVAYAHMMLGAVARWRGGAEAAIRQFEIGLEISRASGNQFLVTLLLAELSGALSSRGDYAEAARMAQDGLAIARAARRDDLTAFALEALSWARVCLGEYETAEAYCREGMALMEQLGSEARLSRATGGLGWIAWCIGGSRLGEARTYIERSLATERKLGRTLWIANYLGDLALIAIDTGDEAQAWTYAQEGLALARALDSAIYTTYHLSILGRVAASRREFTDSRRYLSAALQAGYKAGLWIQLTLTVYQVAQALIQEAAFAGADNPIYLTRHGRAIELLAAIAHYPAAWHVLRARARRQIDDVWPNLPASLVETAIAHGQQPGWPLTIETLLAELNQPTWSLAVSA